VRYTGKRDTALRPLEELIDSSSLVLSLVSSVLNVEKCFVAHDDDDREVDDDDTEDGVRDGTVGANPTFGPTQLLLSPFVVPNVLDDEENARLLRVNDVQLPEALLLLLLRKLVVVGIGGGTRKHDEEPTDDDEIAEDDVIMIARLNEREAGAIVDGFIGGTL